MLTIHQLSVDYRSLGGQTSCALAGVSLTIAEGEIVGLLGESGSGKSTLGLALCNALPDSVVSVRGAIYWDVESSSLAKSAEEDVAAATHAALIPQSPSLTFSPYLRCGSQVEDVLHSRGVDRHQATLQTQQLLAEAGLPSARDAIRAYPHELSGGELQRVAIARALASRPRLLVADEATSALDLLHAVRLQHTLREISRARGLAVLWITHDPRELPGFAHRVALLEQGCLVEEMTGAAFARGDVGAHTRRYLDAIPATWTADGAVSTHAAVSEVSALRRQDPAP